MRTLILKISIFNLFDLKSLPSLISAIACVSSVAIAIHVAIDRLPRVDRGWIGAAGGAVANVQVVLTAAPVAGVLHLEAVNYLSYSSNKI